MEKKISKISILVIDNEPEHQNTIIKKFINYYFHNYKDCLDDIKRAKSYEEAKRIIDENPAFDIIFSDLNLGSNTAHHGDAVLKYASRKKNGAKTRYFIASDFLNKGIFHDMEAILIELLGVESFTKDDHMYPEKIVQKFNKNMQKWTRHMLTNIDEALIPFDNILKGNDLTAEVTFKDGSVYQLKTLLVNYLIKNSRNLQEILSEVKKQFDSISYDFPKIGDRLFKENFGGERPLFAYSLEKYYKKFYKSDIDKLEKEIFPDSKKLLNHLVIIMASEWGFVNKIQYVPEEVKSLLDQMNTPMSEIRQYTYSRGRFFDRLILRLFVLGGYILLQAPYKTLYNFIFNNKVEIDRWVEQSQNCEPYLQRYLWIYHTNEARRISNRNFKMVWDSATKYERDFLLRWWDEIKNSDTDVFKKVVEKTKDSFDYIMATDDDE
jgi:hypothetical protein